MHKRRIFLNRRRQDKILKLVNSHNIATQQELVEMLAAHRIEATQSSVSRDIVKLGLTKANGHYVAPQAAPALALPSIEIDTAGDHLIVLKTEVGQAQLVAVKIDATNIKEIVGTLAGDDTIFIATKDSTNQRAAIKALNKLFALSGSRIRRGAR
jgi:transcriptional regulator of arginine metabolism